jgi:hypothetical protein
MVERRERPRFALEAGEAFGIGGECLRQDLQRDVANELRIAAALHLAHAAGAEGRTDFIGAEARARRETHRRGLNVS